MKKKHLKVLQDIQSQIPEDLLRSLIKKEKQFSAIKETVERGLLEPDDVVSPEKKKTFRAMLDSGYLDREVDVIDTSVEEVIDDLMEAMIAKAVKEGRLPDRTPALNLINNKGKVYAKKQAERLRALFSGEVPTMASEEEVSPAGEA